MKPNPFVTFAMCVLLGCVVVMVGALAIHLPHYYWFNGPRYFNGWQTNVLFIAAMAGFCSMLVILGSNDGH